MQTDDILQLLTGGDRRSIGRANEVVEIVLADSELFETVLGGIFTKDPLVRMRCADVIEKITAQEPAYLQPYKDVLINNAAAIEQSEVRWHLAQILPRLQVNADERNSIYKVLSNYLNDRSLIVRTFALQALSDLAADDLKLQAKVTRLLEEKAESGSPAERARARKLLRVKPNSK